MKRVFVICLLCLLSSCASTGDKDSAKLAEPRKNISGFDEAYMSRVERQASRHGVIVKWIHPPLAQKPKKDGQ